MEIMTNQQFQKTLKWLRVIFVIGIVLFVLFIFGIAGLYIYGVVQGPPPLNVPQTSVFYGDDQSVIGETHNGQNRYWVPLEEMSPSIINATISIEDKRFYNHNGFDFKRIAAAAIADIKAMAKVEGASTITQQYARNLFLEHHKTWKRKFTEALYTVRLETNYSKNKILEGYLNTIYYGHGAYGIEAASNYYFNKSASELTLSEASMLAGIPKAPSYYSPKKDLEKANLRQDIVLNSMVVNGYLTEQEALAASQEALKIVSSAKSEQHMIAPYFLDAVKQEIKSKIKIDEQTIEMGGLQIYTTLDPELQKQAEAYVHSIVNPKSEIQTALIAMKPNGEVKALIGGRDYEASPFNRAIQAERMPGSTFKPFLYYTAIKNGFTPSTTMLSEPVSFRYDEGRSIYQPSNFNNYYANDFITMAQALALSDNIYAVKTHMFLGTEELAQTAKSFGITSNLLTVPSLALGTSSVKPIDMVRSYGVLANGGYKVEPIFIKKIVDYTGEVIYEKKPEHIQIADPKHTFVTAHLMKGMFDKKLNDYTSVTGTAIINQLTRPYAGKSGTTATDSWMIGFSPQLVTGVWIGYDKEQKITLYEEKSYAKRIWASFMEAAHKNLPVRAFKPPEGVIGKYINPDNGLLATENCPVSRLTYFVEGTEPTSYCTDHIGHNNQQQPLEEHSYKEEKGWFNKFIDWFSN